jgi:parallel beta-helix repeat protein
VTKLLKPVCLIVLLAATLSLGMAITNLTLVMPGLAAPNTYYVDDNSPDNGGDGSVGHPWKTITYALSKVVADDAIIVAPGTFDRQSNGEKFPLVINVSLTIKAADRANRPAIDAKGTGDVIQIKVDANSVTLDGLVVTGGGASANGAINIEGVGSNASVAVHHCDVINNLADGMHFGNIIGGNVIINSCTVSNNAGDGVFVDNMDSSSFVITGNTMTANGKIGDRGSGIYFKSVYGNSKINISGNTTSNNKMEGVWLIKVYGDSDITLSNNTVSANQDAGVEIDNASGQAVIAIEGNKVTGSNDDAIHLGSVGGEKTPQVMVTGNTLSGNGANGVHVKSMIGDYRVSISSGNNIFDDAKYGILNESSYWIDATKNWWGDASGPAGSGPGRGAPVSSNVKYDDWLKGVVSTTSTVPITPTSSPTPSPTAIALPKIGRASCRERVYRHV